MKTLIKIAITLTAIGVAVRAIRKHKKFYSVERIGVTKDYPLWVQKELLNIEE